MRPDLRAFAGRPVIIGAGVAGLMVALRLAPEPVVLLSKGPPGTRLVERIRARGPCGESRRR
jgi:L-aspartate oxidase